jgi:hypothetical protein
MAIGALFELPGVTQAQYDEITSKLTDGRGLRSLSDWPVEGIQLHVAGPTEDGWRVLDVWESEEAFQRFGEQLGPIASEAGLTSLEPQIFQVHNLITS